MFSARSASCDCLSRAQLCLTWFVSHLRERTRAQAMKHARANVPHRFRSTAHPAELAASTAPATSTTFSLFAIGSIVSSLIHDHLSWRVACRECRQIQIENETFHVFSARVLVCLLCQLSEFARVRLYSMLHLLDDRLRKVQVRRRRKFRPVQAPRILPLVPCSEPTLQRDPQGCVINWSAVPLNICEDRKSTVTRGEAKSTESKMRSGLLCTPLRARQVFPS